MKRPWVGERSGKQVWGERSDGKYRDRGWRRESKLCIDKRNRDGL